MVPQGTTDADDTINILKDVITTLYRSALPKYLIFLSLSLHTSEFIRLGKE
jgi:hypothetical protein